MTVLHSQVPADTAPSTITIGMTVKMRNTVVTRSTSDPGSRPRSSRITRFHSLPCLLS